MPTEWPQPTPERPLLVGLLVDVSGSMLGSIENKSGGTQNRLESFRDSLEDLVRRARELSTTGQAGQVAPLVNVFAYGFGFGNPLARILGDNGPDVRDLLVLPGERDSTAPIDRLAGQWTRYRGHLQKLARSMAGSTPMVQGFEEAGKRLRDETRRGRYIGGPILFVLSDGMPDASPDRVADLATSIKSAGALIVSCYVTDQNIAAPRHLYGDPHLSWPDGARLMFEIASEVPPNSPFSYYLGEYKWKIEPRARLFTQINQSEILSEFMKLVLSPLEAKQDLQPQIEQPASRVFVSYSHEDDKWLDRLRVFLKPLVREGQIDLWSDKRIAPGSQWRAQIDSALNEAAVAVLLISANFLASDFIAEAELPVLLAAAEKRGLTVLPVIVGPSQFSKIPGLAKFQAVNSPDRPLTSLRQNDRDEVLNDVANTIRDLMSRRRT